MDRADLRVDRALEVPLGTQLAWKLTALIEGGGLKPGDRLPSLRAVAEAAGVNVNTVRSVYQRLEAEGAIETRHGSGTFVARVPPPLTGDLARVVAEVEDQALRAGIDPREVATRLYAAGGGESGRERAEETPREDAMAPAEEARARRHRLRDQIAALESALARHVPLTPAPPPSAGPAPPAAGLLGEEELREVRDRLLTRLVAIDAARDELLDWLAQSNDPPAPEPTPARRRRAPGRSVRRARPAT